MPTADQVLAEANTALPSSQNPTNVLVAGVRSTLQGTL